MSTGNKVQTLKQVLSDFILTNGTSFLQKKPLTQVTETTLTKFLLSASIGYHRFLAIKLLNEHIAYYPHPH